MKNNYLYIIICIITVIVLIVLSLGLFYFKWFDSFADKKNSYKVITENLSGLNEAEKAVKETEKKEEQKGEEKAITGKKEIIKEVLKDSSLEKTIKKPALEKTVIYAKGSSLPDQSFDSLGEYISNEEYNYRVSLIKNFKIKTIVINKLTKGNGVSQEYFRVAYIEKMIPAKILGEVVESKEFRDNIPKKYITDEIKIKGLGNNESVTFTNTKIKEILLLWTLGRLTPIHKAWKVKAEK